eukprot:scaffold260452_cov21-Tisochrysis_lutea.AAC.1
MQDNCEMYLRGKDLANLEYEGFWGVGTRTACMGTICWKVQGSYTFLWEKEMATYHFLAVAASKNQESSTISVKCTLGWYLY